jgi:hypothetical protein
MWTVGADDQVRAQLGSVGQGDVDAVVALLECVRLHLRHQAHSLDDVTAGAAEVDGLATGPDSRRDLDDDYAVAVLGQPEGE